MNYVFAYEYSCFVRTSFYVTVKIELCAPYCLYLNDAISLCSST